MPYKLMTWVATLMQGRQEEQARAQADEAQRKEEAMRKREEEAAARRYTLRFAEILAKCMLKYYIISECGVVQMIYMHTREPNCTCFHFFGCIHFDSVHFQTHLFCLC